MKRSALYSIITLLMIMPYAAQAAELDFKPGPDIQKLLQYKDAIKDDAQNLSIPGFGSIAPGTGIRPGGVSGVGSGGNPKMYMECTYTVTPLQMSYTMTYLGFIFGQETAPFFGTPFYQACLEVARGGCNFLTFYVGAPQPLKVVFTGSIINATKTCGNF